MTMLRWHLHKYDGEIRYFNSDAAVTRAALKNAIVTLETHDEIVSRFYHQTVAWNIKFMTFRYQIWEAFRQ